MRARPQQCPRPPPAGLAPRAPERWVTQGPGEVVVDKLYDCPVVVDNYRGAAVGRITAADGTVFTVPAETAYQEGLGPKSVDLYNECTEIMPRDTSEVSADVAPVIDVDPDGEVIRVISLPIITTSSTSTVSSYRSTIRLIHRSTRRS